MLRIAYEGGGAGGRAAGDIVLRLSYEWIAKKIAADRSDADKHPFYGEWIRGYASESYHKENEVLVEWIEPSGRGSV